MRPHVPTSLYRLLLSFLALLLAGATVTAAVDVVTVRGGPLLVPVAPLPPAPDDVSFYNPTTGLVTALFPAATNNPSSNNVITYDPARTRAIVTGGAGQDAIQVFDLTTPAPTLLVRHTLETPPADLDMTPDGRFAVVKTGFAIGPGATPTLAVFVSPATGAIAATFNNLTNGATIRGPNLIAITPDSSRAVITGGAGPLAIQVYDLTGALPVLLANLPLASLPHDVDVAPGGQLAVVRGGGHVAFVNVVTGTLVSVVATPPSNPLSSNAIAFTPDGSRAVVTGGPGSGAVLTFDLAPAVPALVANLALTNAVGDVDVSPDGRFAVVRSGPSPGAASALDVAFVNPVGGGLVVSFPAATNNANRSSNSIAFTPDSSRAFVTGGAGADAVHVYDLTPAVPVQMAKRSLSTAPDDVHVTPDARFAIVRSGPPPFPPPGGPTPDAVAFYTPATAAQVALFPAASSNPWDANSIAVLPDSTRAFVTGGAGQDAVQVFDLTPAVPVLLVRHSRTNPPQDVNDSPSPQDLHQPFAEDIREEDLFPTSGAALQIETPFGVETVRLSGPAAAHVSIGPNGEALDSDGDGLDEVRTEMVQLQLAGTSPSLGPVQVRLRNLTQAPFGRSFGEIEEAVNLVPGRLDVPPFAPSGTAASFFDVFFEVELNSPGAPPGTLPIVLHGEEGKHGETPISHKPPAAGEGYAFQRPTQLADPNGNPAAARVLQGVHVPRCEANAPLCQVNVMPGVGANGSMQDTESGLATVVVVKAENADVVVGGVTPGTNSAVGFSATKKDSTKPSSVTIRATDVCGNSIICDPVILIVVRERGKPVTETLTGLPQEEGQLTLTNGSPGIRSLHVTVNGNELKLTGLADGERRVEDISAWMRPGEGNVVTVEAHGPPGGSAEVVLHN